MEYRYLKDINLIFSSQDHAHKTVNTFDIHVPCCITYENWSVGQIRFRL